MTMVAGGYFGYSHGDIAGRSGTSFGGWSILDFLLVDALLTLAVGAVLAVAEGTLRSEHVETVLRNNERRFRALIENSADSIALVDADNRILYFSPAVAAVEGYTPEELIGHNGLENTHPEDLPVVDAAVRELLARTGQPVPVLWRRRHKNGRWIWLEGVATNLLRSGRRRHRYQLSRRDEASDGRGQAARRRRTSAALEYPRGGDARGRRPEEIIAVTLTVLGRHLRHRAVLTRTSMGTATGSRCRRTTRTAARASRAVTGCPRSDRGRSRSCGAERRSSCATSIVSSHPTKARTLHRAGIKAMICCSLVRKRRFRDARGASVAAARLDAG